LASKPKRTAKSGKRGEPPKPILALSFCYKIKVMPRNQTDLEAELDRLYREGGKLGFWEKRSYQMFTSHCKKYVGGVEAVKILLRKQQSGGLAFVQKQHRLDLSVEALVLKPEWTHLFDDQDRRLATEKLAKLRANDPSI